MKRLLRGQCSAVLVNKAMGAPVGRSVSDKWALISRAQRAVAATSGGEDDRMRRDSLRQQRSRPSTTLICASCRAALTSTHGGEDVGIGSGGDEGSGRDERGAANKNKKEIRQRKRDD